MRHKWKVSVMAVGAAITLLLGSGMFSLTGDSVTSQTNSLESGTLVVAHDIKAVKAPVNGCGVATGYSDGPISAAISTPAGTPNFSLEEGSALASQPDDFCIKNFGAQPADLRVAFLALVQKEVGAACQASEASPSEGADTTCAANAAGELASVLLAVLRVSEGGTCAGMSNDKPFLEFNAAAQPLDLSLAPNEVCSVFLEVTLDSSSTLNQRLAAQTDRIEFSIVFLAGDVV